MQIKVMIQWCNLSLAKKVKMLKQRSNCSSVTVSVRRQIKDKRVARDFVYHPNYSMCPTDQNKNINCLILRFRFLFQKQ